MKTKHTPIPWETGALMTRVEVLPEGWRMPMCVADCHAKHAPENECERVANAEFIVLAVNNHERLVSALRKMINHYTGLVNSGDAGNWNPETEPQIIEARETLSALTVKE